MIEMEVIGVVRATRQTATDDFWGATQSEIVLADTLSEQALDGIEAFSHAEILFLFDRVDPNAVERGARHPRGNPAWPRVGILAQRAKNRPNRIGSTIVRVIGRHGRVLTVAELDAIDGTPVLDIKPVMREFLPRETTRQAPWSEELMAHYWSQSD
jgi:tRNA-Thr(GGU) m(6)t(6)A37 methyltransferase TsaA